MAAVVQRLRADCGTVCAFYLWHHRAGIGFQFGKYLVLLLVEQSGRESARMCSRAPQTEAAHAGDSMEPRKLDPLAAAAPGRFPGENPKRGRPSISDWSKEHFSQETTA